MRRLLEALSRVRPVFWAGLGLALAGAGIAVRRRRAAADGGAAANGGPPFTYPSFLTGQKLTYTTISEDGLVYADPEGLARTAGSDLETYTVARVLASETSGPPIEKAAIAWAVRNHRDRRGKSILSFGTKEGLYGRQARVGYMATSKDPTDRDLYVATMVLAGAWPDPTGGAEDWYHPADQDAIFERGGTSYDADALLQKRIDEGWTPVYVAGAPAIVLFRRA